jgi:hypothetical protein
VTSTVSVLDPFVSGVEEEPVPPQPDIKSRLANKIAIVLCFI